MVHARLPSSDAITDHNAYFLASHKALASSSVVANWNMELPCRFTIACTVLAAALMDSSEPWILKNKESRIGYVRSTVPAAFIVDIAM